MGLSNYHNRNLREILHKSSPKRIFGKKSFLMKIWGLCHLTRWAKRYQLRGHDFVSDKSRFLLFLWVFAFLTISKSRTLPLSEAFYRSEKSFRIAKWEYVKVTWVSQIHRDFLWKKSLFSISDLGKNYFLVEYCSEKDIIGFVVSSGGNLKTDNKNL